MALTHAGTVRALFRGLTFIILMVIGAAGSADDLDEYRYVLEASADDKTCPHMERVYNQRFKQPWKRPPLTNSKDDPAYGPAGVYSFPKLPGVIHDNRATFHMGYSRQPSSPEFDAITWREGRFGFSTHRDRPMLVAELDIDNNGKPDLVIKRSFMEGFEPSHGSAPGGEDTLLVFEIGALDLQREIHFAPGFRVANAKPATIHGAYERRLIRPFVLNGVVFLSTYEQVWEGGEFQDLGSRFSRLEGEYMHVLRYKAGAHLLGPGQWSQLEVEPICRYRMEVISMR